MPIVNPTPGTTDAPRTVVYSAPASLAVVRGAAVSVSSARASAHVRGERRDAGRASAGARGQLARPARASASVGAALEAAARASETAGAILRAEARGGALVRGERPRSVPASLGLLSSGSALGARAEDTAAASLYVRGLSGARIESGRGSAQIRGQVRGGSIAAIYAKIAAGWVARASLTLARATVVPVFASGAIGRQLEGRARASLQVEEAEGLEIIVDLIDSVLAGGRGDLC